MPNHTGCSAIVTQPEEEGKKGGGIALCACESGIILVPPGLHASEGERHAAFLARTAYGDSSYVPLIVHMQHSHCSGLM
jgi:hypothetical protein